MTKKIITIVVLAALLGSCVSKKKYVELEQDLSETEGELQKTTVEKEELEAKFAKIEKRVDEYNTKINSLQETNDAQLVLVEDNLTVLSKNTRDNLKVTLANVPAEELAGAKTLKDSMNVAVAYSLKKSINTSDLGEDTDINVNIDQTVVMISVADSLLFKSGSYKVSSKANGLLQKLADVINSEESMDVMIEGHTDSKTIHRVDIEDNWDLSVKRSTAIARLLQNEYEVDPSRLIPAGRSSYVPLTDNDTKESRARNRRTNIIIMPNLDKFFALLAAQEKEVAAVKN